MQSRDGHPTATTFFYERWRAAAGGVLETAGATFLLLVAVRDFQAGAMAKAILATGGSAGLLLTPVTVAVVSSRGWRAARAAAALAAMGGAGFLTAALIPILPIYIAGCVLGLVSGAAAIPLLTQMYQENYPEPERGKLFSRTVMIRIAVAIGFAAFVGRALETGAGFRWLLVLFAAAFFVSCFCLTRVPSRPLRDGGRWFDGFRFVRNDGVFRRALMCWMLMGFANLMMLPLRVEYLANPVHGLALSAAIIAFYTSVLPNAARLLMNPIWGGLFDRVNFFLLRIVLNLGFAVGIATFFLGDHWLGLTAGAICFGVASAGGDVAWSLWVTKVAPPNHVADYMAVHTFLTGVRGVLAPLVAFHVVGLLSVSTLGWISAAMIVVASLLLLPDAHWARRRRAAQPLVEEVSE